MDKIDELEQRVQALSDEELAAFRRWVAQFDGEAWDRQFESDPKLVD